MLGKAEKKGDPRASPIRRPLVRTSKVHRQAMSPAVTGLQTDPSIVAVGQGADGPGLRGSGAPTPMEVQMEEHSGL